MSDLDLLSLAAEAGLTTSWRDAFGHNQQTSPASLRAVLKALDLPADSDTQIRNSRGILRGQKQSAPPPLVTSIVGTPVPLAVQPSRYQIILESGQKLDGVADAHASGAIIPGISEPGYHHLHIADQDIILAVAPSRCFGIGDAADKKLWALAVQLYSLRRHGDCGIGDFPALADFARSAARKGAAAVAISPVHAQFSADPDRFSPYAPSSRIMFNVLHADPGDEPQTAEEMRLESLDQVEWPQAARARLARLRRRFERFEQDPAQMAALARFRQDQGDVLESHARFEALHAHFFGADIHQWNWHRWAAPFRNPRSGEVERFAADHAREVCFHAFMQYLADTSMQAAQRAARDAGMPIGLISDLAVGADGGGSHSWSRQNEMLIGLSIGAPPDLLSRQGQNWGLTAFSPRGLLLNGYGAFLEMLRAALRHAGGVRIDHAMGLERLWVIPEGAGATDGVYLSFPFQDLLRLVMLESSRHRAIVMAEDLGTVPDGFQYSLQDANIMGMRVLWFERDAQQNFTPPKNWTNQATAMTSTHDLPTVAGWWSGRDLEWRQQLGLLGDAANIAHEHEQRWQDRHALWSAFRDSGSAQGDTPMPHDSWPAVDGAIRHVGSSACQFVMLPAEDALALTEQPNLPGTLDEHPNWRRRLPCAADQCLEDPVVSARLRALNEARHAG